MSIIKCECGAPFRCVGCDAMMRRVVVAAPPEPDVRGLPEIQEYLRELKACRAYRAAFPKGGQGGALVTLAPLVTIECFLPFEANDGELLPWVPMPFTGEAKVHDLIKSDRALCEANLCDCARPVGWKLNRTLIRLIANWSDSVVNERSAEIPGRLPCHCLCVDALTFMREVIFGDFSFPARAVSRAARRAANEARGCKPPRPHDPRRTPRRRRR
jgi:hypothetical protein